MGVDPWPGTTTSGEESGLTSGTFGARWLQTVRRLQTIGIFSNSAVVSGSRLWVLGIVGTLIA